MNIKIFVAVGRAVFCQYEDGSKKLLAECAFSGTGFTYEQALENARVIAETLNHAILQK